MKPKFTSGPWIALKGAGWLVTRPDATARRETAIAVGMTPAVSLVESPWFDETEVQANATLIAAAPDMYAALEDALQAMLAWDFGTVTLVPIISAALKKAGRQ